MLSDVEIMERVQGGETALFALLVERYRLRLLRFALSKTRDHAAAEDMVQDAFLAAYAARDTYRSQFAFSTWIWTILLNLSRQQRRRAISQNIRQSLYRQQGAPASSAVCGLTQLLHTEQQEQVHLWLVQLPEAQADAIRLRFFGELSYEEIALAMDSSLSGAKVRVRNGLQRLAELARLTSDMA